MRLKLGPHPTSRRNDAEIRVDPPPSDALAMETTPDDTAAAEAGDDDPTDPLTRPPGGRL
jgi:hypothetical protein